MRGELAPLHRKALLNALKTAAGLDPDRLDELLRATHRSFVQLGWNTGEDLWTIGPLLEIAGRMAQHEDQVDSKLPNLARNLARQQVVSPDFLGGVVDREESLTLSLLAMTARMERMVERERFGLEPEECRAWITDMLLQSAAYLYQELENQDAAASERADVGAEGKQMVLQASLRESLNILEPIWFRESARIDAERRTGSLEALRDWIESDPMGKARSEIVAAAGEGVNQLITRLQEVRTQIDILRLRLRQGLPLEEEVSRQPAGKGPENGERPVVVAATAVAVRENAPAQPATVELQTTAALQETGTLQRHRFGRRR